MISGELRECPFCGGKKIILNQWLMSVRCKDCGVSTEPTETEAEAIAAWNKRVGVTDEH